MSKKLTYQAAHPVWGEIAYRLSYPLLKALAQWRGLHTTHSRYAQERAATFAEKLARGQPLYLLGLGPGGHNAGASLVEVTAQQGVKLICNNEEERFTGLKHYADYPALSVADMLAQLESRGLKPTDIHACLTNWHYPQLLANSVRVFAEEFPSTLALLKPQPRETFLTDHRVILEALTAPQRLGRQLGLNQPLPLINLRHHDNHAYFAYAVSPFARLDQPVMVVVSDGSGDDGAISLYLGQRGQLRLVYDNRSMFDSLGTLYTMLSATQGGWTPLSSEGRYMGAAAWGDQDRLTNPFYPQLRQLLYFGPAGQIFLNRSLANWPRAGYAQPYTPALTDLLGPPILPAQMWQPDRVLRLDEADSPSTFTQERLDKAAATQLLLEDALFHLIGHFIRTSGSHHLVFAGGTALNCVANMHLLDRFAAAYYARHVGKSDTRLQLWVPPIPGDAGTPVGAAYHFALRHGAKSGEPLQHAFYCGQSPTTAQILAALEPDDELEFRPLGNILETDRREQIADWLASLIAQDSFIGLFQGVAETGPRALGHRSILGNPCQPHTLRLLNERVKFREPFRPLAPMLTFAAAERWFELSPGAAAANYNAYNYMVLTARAKPEAQAVIPAVIHRDGSSRLQIVRAASDPFTHAYLRAMGRRVGVEVSVNTSLNVGSPIVQTPCQAVQTLKRARAMTSLLLIGADGAAFVAWSRVVAETYPPILLNALKQGIPLQRM